MAQKVISLNNLSNELKIVAGEVALDGSGATSVAIPGITTAVAVILSQAGATTPGDSTEVLTYDFGTTEGQLDIYPWKNTNGTDPTLVASDGTQTVSYVVIGY